MKKYIAVILSLILIFIFASCGADDGAAADIENANKLYESMTEAIENADYDAAIEYYNNGAADSDNVGLLDSYYYAVAMNEYTEKGCLGYALDVLLKCGDEYKKAENAYSQLQSLTESFEGTYSCKDYYYLYFSDGKIAVGVGEKLTGAVYCNGELVLIDNTYYWAEHNSDGEDTLIYEVDLTQSGVLLTAVDENNSTYAGEYGSFSTQMPTLVY